ncbi:hypothetical protein Syun_021145 [Stephania yunnanensis]|uniref:Helicase C-terminal domain-containing protein n=1 Tax=Stephania yunnanensis TaxID=152371 RepID=A0AAP0IG20_9MAGN
MVLGYSLSWVSHHILFAKIVAVGYHHNSSCGSRTARQLSNQEVGMAKLSGFREWLSIQPIISESECTVDVEMHVAKMIIFAHHLKVLDGVQEFLCEKGIGFVRIDGNTLARDRQSAVQAFRSSAEIKAAIIGITAGGVGIDFSSAQHVVFVELPHTVSELLQAEDRAHRRGQANAVNIYIFCAKDTCDELHWQNLNKSLNRVSSVMNGKYYAVREIEVDNISDVERGFLEHGHRSAEGHLNKELNVVDFDSNHVSSFDGITCQDGVSEVTLSNRFSEAEATNFGCGATNHTVHLNTNLGEMHMLEMDGCRVKAELLNFGFGDVKVVPDVPREIDPNSSVLEDSLRFEVSQYTGRIHLYTCVSGRDSRPRLLFENFHVEEIKSSSCFSHNIRKTTQLVKENPRFRNVLLRFVSEWNDLRPIEQRKLLGKPLQLPLSLELYYLKESFSHGNGGLLKGGSKRRTTPLHEISHEAPENTVWKQISLFSGQGKEKQYMQYWTTDGDPLCKLCQTPCNGILAKAPEYFEDLFCNLNCFEEYRTRTSRRFIREELFKIEHGVCRLCKLDCHKLVRSIKPLSVASRKSYIEKIAPKFTNYKKIFDKLIQQPIEGNAWHADHIVAVHQGGGECNLENIRTLCVACHSEVTAAQRTKKSMETHKAKKQLKVIMSELKDNRSEKIDSNMKGKHALKLQYEKLRMDRSRVNCT